ncbi:MAG: methyltransferase domain-containing protein [Methanobacteriaceae archaeon]|nr:methyltransferase domain-containing protein [Methanobacteriaceae archaeon]
MKITSYQENLLSDQERLTAFFEAISQKSRGIVYDLGTGSGVLAAKAAPQADHVYAVEKDKFSGQMALNTLSHFNNVSVMLGDATQIDFPEKADLIICEMLDTGLIDEDLIPVIKHARPYLKEGGQIIPCEVLNGVEPINLRTEHLCYQESAENHFEVLGPLKIYSRFNLTNEIDEKVDVSLKLKINCNGTVSGIRITTFTILTPDLICGPTPMLNPPLLVPSNSLKVEKNDEICLNLKYIMGGGLNTLKARIN